MLSVTDIVEIIAVVMLLLGLCVFVWHTITIGEDIGVTAIQIMIVIVLLPVIAILALEKILGGHKFGAWLGGITGFLLSGISNDDESEDSNSK